LREVAGNVSVQTLPGVRPFGFAHFIDLGSFKKVKKLKYIFLNVPNF